MSAVPFFSDDVNVAENSPEKYAFTDDELSGFTSGEWALEDGEEDMEGQEHENEHGADEGREGQETARHDEKKTTTKNEEVKKRPPAEKCTTRAMWSI